MAPPVVHWEIGGRDLGGLREFYAKAFGWSMTDAGANSADRDQRRVLVRVVP